MHHSTAAGAARLWGMPGSRLQWREGGAAGGSGGGGRQGCFRAGCQALPTICLIACSGAVGRSIAKRAPGRRPPMQGASWADALCRRPPGRTWGFTSFQLLQ